MKRCKERCLEEAAQLLRHTPEPQLQVLQDTHLLLLLLVRLLISLQLQMVHISTACRKVDQVSPTARLLALHGVELQLNLIKFARQMLQHLAKVDRQLVLRETHQCVQSVVHSEQVTELNPHMCSPDVCVKSPLITLIRLLFQILSLEDLQRGWYQRKMVFYSSVSHFSCKVFMSLFQPVCSWRTAPLVVRRTDSHTRPC